MKPTQNQIAEYFGEWQSTISRVLTGSRPMSQAFSEKLAALCPERTPQEWKRTQPRQLKAAFRRIISTTDTGVKYYNPGD